MAITVVGALLAAQIADGVTGCGSVDPTDPSNYSSVKILNDTRNPVVVDGCRGTYCGPEPSSTLASGQRTTVRGACGAAGADMTSWRLARTDGWLLGYLAIATPRSTNDLTYRVSQASTDRLRPTTPG